MAMSTHPPMEADQPAASQPAAARIHRVLVGPAPCSGDTLMVWGHGWGQSHGAFHRLIKALPGFSHLALDFPGFGQSPLPPAAWGTADYADALVDILRPYREQGVRIVWLGHSFGGRVGLQLAARHPELVDRLCLVSAAGLQRKRGAVETIRRRLRQLVFKLLLAVVPALGGSAENLRSRFGSADYRNAGKLRPTFVRVVTEDLTDVARRVGCPTLLVYGADDTETPPEFGERLVKLIANAELCILPRHDHYSVLDEGHHLVLKRLMSFLGAP